MIYISESLLYICFAIVTGTLIVQLIPQRYKPTIIVPKWVMMAAIIAIPICSYFPLHELILNNAAIFELSYIDMLKSVLTDLSVGEAWVWTLMGSIGLIVMIAVPAFNRDQHMPKVALLLTLLLCVWLGYASHASSLSAFKGLIVHTGHFVSVVVWLGILIVISFFSKDLNNMGPFLKWFSPLALICVLMTLIAGFTLMTFTTPQYVSSWMLNYGQMLLLKHITIIPLLWLAFSNGFLYSKLIQHKPAFQPLPYLRLESLVGIVVLILTAIMGQQTPPHNLKETLQTESPSLLFTSIYQGAFSPDSQLSFHIQMETILLWVAALLMLYAVRAAYVQSRVWIAAVCSILFVMFVYFSLMFSIQ